MRYEVEDLIGCLDDTWTSLADVCADLAPREWALPTGCPGWSVQDNVAHVIGVELELMGRPSDHTLPEVGLDHVRDDFGRAMERAVDERRSREPDAVLAELRDVTKERLAQLRGMGDADLEAEVPGPFGSPVPFRRLLPIRVFDCWVHEQDVRVATSRPGGWDGPAARASIDRMVAAVGSVVPKAITDVEATVTFDVAGMDPRAFTVPLGSPESGASNAGRETTLTLGMDLATFTGLCCGRTDPGDVRIDGDRELADRVISSLGFTP